MQYFVTLEDTRDYRWQAELLYESIKLLDLQEQFVIAICPGKGAVKRHRYPNIVYFENIGRKLGFPKFNKCYGLAKAIQSGYLKQPFTILEPDMFLLHGLPLTSSPAAAQFHRRLAWDNVKDQLEDFTTGAKWSDLGVIYQFNGVPNRVFEDTIKHTLDLYNKLGNKQDIHHYGFTMGIMNNGVRFEHRTDFEMPLNYNSQPDVDWNSHIVHYRDGYLPYFKKQGAFDTLNFSFNIPLPMKAILEIPMKNQPNIAIMQTLIRSWIDSNLTRLWDLL